MRYSPTQVIYSEGERENSGMSAVSTEDWPEVRDSQASSPGMTSIWVETGWNITEKVVFCSSEQTPVKVFKD